MQIDQSLKIGATRKLSRRLILLISSVMFLNWFISVPHFKHQTFIMAVSKYDQMCT